jgi:cell division protein FtsI/penicillin-binding protein 2
LKGYDDHAQLIDVVNPRTGRHQTALHRDFRALLPLARHRYQPDREDIKALRGRDRDLRTSIDARLQLRVGAALQKGIASNRFTRGAAVVLDAATGEVLAAASYPWPQRSDFEGDAEAPRDAQVESAADERAARWLDRARYGLYPPGSTFKLVIAGAALRTHDDTCADSRGRCATTPWIPCRTAMSTSSAA